MSDQNNDNSQSQPDEIFTIDFEQIERVAQVFFEESKDILENLEAQILKLERDPEDIEQINLLFRKIHTLKGSVGAVPGGQLLGSLAHEFEALLNRIKQERRSVSAECVDLFLKSSRLLKVLAEALREKREIYPEVLSEVIEAITCYGSFQFVSEGQGQTAQLETRGRQEQRGRTESEEEQGVWLSTKQLNEMLRISGELLVLKNFFSMMNQTVNFRIQPELYERRQNDFNQSLSKICDQFQTQIQSVRKEKAEESFQSLPLLVRQASTELNKAVNFEMTGLNLLIDKALGQDLSEGLVHLIRNSIDHGIEDQFDRTVQGKPSFGSLKLDISERSGVIHLIFKDDGAGLDRERILRKALQSGLVREEDVPTLTEDQIHRFIFHAGFSTREKITTISGRGVGMDVVQNIVEKYGGTISISTTQGQGTEFHIEVPAPQHILVETTLLCSWQNFHLALPLASIRHITSCTELQITTVNHQRFCQFSGLTVPLLNYQEILRQRTCDLDTKVKASSAVFLSHKDFVLALIVDRVEGQTDLVVKKFGEIINEQKGFKGVSILADENIAFVIDPELLLSQMSMSAEKSEEEDAA